MPAPPAEPRLTIRPPGASADREPTITAAPTSVALFAGWAPRGPVGEPMPVASWPAYARAFGGVHPRSPLGPAVQGFFNNGGTEAWVLRVARADATSPGPVLAAGTPAFDALLLTAFGPGSATDALAGYNLLAVPGLTHAPTLAELQTEARRRRALLLVDANPALDLAAFTATATDGLTGADAGHSALYHPWLRVPDAQASSGYRSVPPSGHVAGVIARNDRRRGVWKAPAGLQAQLRGIAGLAPLPGGGDIGPLGVLGINPLRDQPGHGPVIWGARTLASPLSRATDLALVPTRRLALHIEDSLLRGTRWAVFEPQGESLWARMRQAAEGFMDRLFRQGALAGQTPEHAYQVRCDRSTHTAADLAGGLVQLQVGFAALKPAEFSVLRIRQHTGPASQPPRRP